MKNPEQSTQKHEVEWLKLNSSAMRIEEKTDIEGREKHKVRNGEVPGEESENQEGFVGNNGDEKGERRAQRYQGVADPCCYCHRLLPRLPSFPKFRDWYLFVYLQVSSSKI